MDGGEFWRPGTRAPGSSASVLDEQAEEGEGPEDAGAVLHAALGTSPAGLSMDQFRDTLPVARHRQDFLYLVEQHAVVIVVGQTGSGKTTQLPQYLYEAGWTSEHKRIACTQPRRVAAVSVAARVAEETGTELGGLVGYTVRFDDRHTPALTRIKYLTDGMLFREALFDPLLSAYSVVMVDEAHERSLHTDLLLGLLKKIMRQRPELRVVVSSATMDADSFLAFFAAPPRSAGPLGGPALREESPAPCSTPAQPTPTILSVEGRMHPVEVFYLAEEAAAVECAEEAAATVLKLHMVEGPGDVLVFLPGREDIERCLGLLRGAGAAPLSRARERIAPLPLYAGLPLEQQMRVFERAAKGTRKVVLATNIAETSLTIDGVVFVVDCGLAKQKIFNPATGLETLVTAPISQASAQQRAGRAGRVRPGRAFRLYTEERYAQMVRSSIPEIQKCNLAPVVLQLKALGIDNVIAFDFMARLPADSMARAMEFLYALGALDAHAKLTAPVGTRMAELPVEPMLARMLIASDEFGCGAEAATIAAMISVQPVFVSVGAGSRRALEEAKRKVAVEEGDLVSYVNIFRSYQESGASPRWCQKHFINQKAMERAVGVRSLLAKYMDRYGLRSAHSAHGDVASVVRCIVKGLFANAARAQPDGSYLTVRDSTRVYIHPSSVLFRRVPDCVVFYEVLQTTKTFISNVSVVDSDWLAELAPNYYELAKAR